MIMLKKSVEKRKKEEGKKKSKKGFLNISSLAKKISKAELRHIDQLKREEWKIWREKARRVEP